MKTITSIQPLTTMLSASVTKKLPVMVLAAAMALSANSAFAGLKTWASASSTSWNTAGNWSASGVPASTDYANFSSTGASVQPIIDGAGLACQFIQMSSSASANRIIAGADSTPRTLTLGTGFVSVDGANKYTYITGAKTTFGLTINNGGGGLTLNLNSTYDPGYIAAANTVTLNCVLSSTGAGAVGFIRNGSGGVAWVSGNCQIVLGAANTYTKNTRLINNGGTVSILQLANSSALQSSTLDMNSADSGTLSFGTLTAATLGGLTGSRTLALQNDSSAAVTVSIGNNGVSTSYSGQLTGAGALTKVGAGTLTLSAANSYAGPTTISASGGTLEGSVAGSIKGNVTVHNGGIMKVDTTTTLDSTATVTLDASPSASTVNLAFSGTQNIKALYFGGTAQATGSWGASGSGATHTSTAFTSTGMLYITPAPVFSTQPPATASVVAGGNLSIGPVAASDTTSYQWQKNGGTFSGTEYSGINSATLTITAAVAGDAGTYTCVATGPGGSTTSSQCVLTVGGGMVITGPNPTANVNQGSSVSIGPVSVTGCGSTISYQWQVDHGSGAANVSGSEYSGANTVTLTINPAASGDAGTYTCIASATGCGPNVTSSGCVLTVNLPPAAAPTAAYQSGETTSQITWNWTDAATDQTGYHVYDAASGGNLKGTVTSRTIVSFTETGLTAGNTYTRWGAAYNAVGDGPRAALLRAVASYTATWHPIGSTAQSTCSGDTYLSGLYPDGSYVTATAIGCGYNSLTGLRRAMVQFDQSTMPAASLWHYGPGQATLQMVVSAVYSSSGQNVTGWKVTLPWDETTTLPTYNTHYTAKASSSLMVASVAGVGSTATFNWDPATGMPDNGKGLMFTAASDGTTDNTQSKIFYSKENTSAQPSPAMSLNYYLPGNPGWITKLLVLPGVGDASIDTVTYATAAGLTGDTDMYGNSTKTYGSKTWTAYTGDTTDVAGFSDNYGWNLANSPYNMGVNICALFNLYVHSDVAASGCYLRCGSDDGVRLIVNGTTVGTDDVNRGWAMEQSVFGPFSLNAGWNRVLIKVRNGSGGTGVKAVRFSNADATVWSGSTLTYAVDDTTAPTNPTGCTESGGALSGVCQSAVSSPSFAWSEAADAAGSGEGASGVRGYLVYFGPSASGVPSGTIQAGTTFAPGTQTPGTYYLRVITVDNAMNQSAATTLFVFQYSPAAPTAGSDSPICAGSTLHLTASTVSGATYAWTGPNEFTSSVQDPTIAGATTAVTGTYSVTATVGGCTSTAGTTSVTVNGATTSAISGSTAVAANQLGKISFVTLTSGSSYAWTVPSGATIIAGATGPNNNQITVNFGSTSGNVTVTETTAASCVGTPVSLGVSVTGNQAPVAPPNKTLSTAKNTAATFDMAKLLAGATDADGDTLTVTAANTTTAGAAVLLEAGDVKYTPPTGFTGSDSYTYTIDDGHGGTAVGTVNVTVTANSGGSPNVVGDPTYDSGTGKFSVTFAGIPGVEYTVEYAEGSAAPPWNKLMNITAGSDGLFVVEDTAAQSPGRYYRTVYPSY